MNREPISAFVVCFNEEDQIGDCLRSLSFCDEIVCIDSFSTDRTIELCKEFGAKVVQRTWPGYREQKSFGLSQTSHEWVINLDADERVSDELRENIIRILEEDYKKKNNCLISKDCNIVSGYSINRVVYFLGRWWRKGGWYPEYRIRFFRKSKVVWGGVDPHEKPIVNGMISKLDGEILHFTYKNIEEQLARLHNLSTIAARQEFNRGRKAGFSQILISPIVRTLKFLIVKKGYREGIAGLVVAITEGYYTFIKYAKIWELHHVEGGNNEDK